MRQCIYFILVALSFLEKYLLYSGHFQYLSRVSLVALMLTLFHFIGIVLPTVCDVIK